MRPSIQDHGALDAAISIARANARACGDGADGESITLVCDAAEELLRRDTCVVCLCQLLPPEAPPHCETCSIAEWEEEQNVDSELDDGST